MKVQSIRSRLQASENPRFGPWGRQKCEDTGPLLHGYQAAGKTFRVHLDGYDQRDLQGWRLRTMVCRARFCNCARAGDSGADLQSFPEFLPRQRPGAFSIDQVVERLRSPPSSN